MPVLNHDNSSRLTVWVISSRGDLLNISDSPPGDADAGAEGRHRAKRGGVNGQHPSK